MHDKYYNRKFINKEFGTYFPKMSFLGKIPMMKIVFALLYPKYGVLYFHRKNRRLFSKRNPFNRFYFLMNHYKNSIEINPTATLGEGVKTPHPYAIVIGGTTVLADNCSIMSCVILGSNSAMNKEGYPTLGESCYVGTGAEIIGEIEIGSNSIIGANCVVTKSFGTNSIIIGNSSKLLEGNE